MPFAGLMLLVAHCSHTDFMLIVLRELLAVRTDLRVIVMSATLQVPCCL